MYEPRTKDICCNLNFSQFSAVLDKCRVVRPKYQKIKIRLLVQPYQLAEHYHLISFNAQ